MSKKKSSSGGSKAKAAVEDENVVTRQMVLANYGKLCKWVHECILTFFCVDGAPPLTTLWCLLLVCSLYGRLIGVPVNTHINDILRGGEEEEELVNVRFLRRCAPVHQCVCSLT